MTHRRMVANLRRLYRNATPDELTAGRSWYPRAVAGCVAWSQEFGIAPHVVANVIAAISPQCEWNENLRTALDVLKGNPTTGRALRRNVGIARRVLQDAADSLDAYFKSGPKVKNFAANLAGDRSRVTIDTHAAQAAYNDPLFKRALDRAGRYSALTAAYRAAAVADGVDACDYQAVVWLVWKRTHRPGVKRAMARRLASAA
jgi:hypothetical protein